MLEGIWNVSDGIQNMMENIPTMIEEMHDKRGGIFKIIESIWDATEDACTRGLIWEVWGSHPHKDDEEIEENTR